MRRAERCAVVGSYKGPATATLNRNENGTVLPIDDLALYMTDRDNCYIRKSLGWELAIWAGWRQSDSRIINLEGAGKRSRDELFCDALKFFMSMPGANRYRFGVNTIFDER